VKIVCLVKQGPKAGAIVLGGTAASPVTALPA